MIELRLLGAVDLAGVPPERAQALLAQSKSVAVLIYLALATPAGFHRRDRLVGLLWPELDQEHARAALRKAIHLLRRALGDTILVARGDEDVGLAPDAVWCDALAVRDAVEAGRYAQALELYRRGELLPGFFVPQAGEFEDWLARERSDLRDRAAAAAWGLAAHCESAGELTVADRWARRAAELAPTDERVLRRVMAMLDRLGDRAGAVHVYEDFARRLKREYGAEPSAETRGLVGEIRAR